MTTISIGSEPVMRPIVRTTKTSTRRSTSTRLSATSQRSKVGHPSPVACRTMKDISGYERPSRATLGVPWSIPRLSMERRKHILSRLLFHEMFFTWDPLALGMMLGELEHDPNCPQEAEVLEFVNNWYTSALEQAEDIFFSKKYYPDVAAAASQTDCNALSGVIQEYLSNDMAFHVRKDVSCPLSSYENISDNIRII